MSSIYNYYDNLRTAAQNDFRNRVYLDHLLEILISMFDYDNLPDTIPKRFLELYLITSGSVGIAEIDGKLTAFRANPTGQVDNYGIGTDLVGACPNGDFEGTIGKDCVWGINNDFARPDMDIWWEASTLSDIDISLNYNIKYSRVYPMPIAHDSKQKYAFDEALSAMLEGDLISVVSDNLIDRELGNEGATLQLTDPTQVERIQHLSRAWEDIWKRFYNKYGHALQTQNKSAQQTTDEIHGMDSTSWIIPIMRLSHRQQMVEEINRIFGTNISVHFSPTWEIQYKLYTTTQEPMQEPLQEPMQEPQEEPLQEPLMSDAEGESGEEGEEKLEEDGKVEESGEVGESGEVEEASQDGESGEGEEVQEVVEDIQEIVEDITDVINKEETPSEEVEEDE